MHRLLAIAFTALLLAACSRPPAPQSPPEPGAAVRLTDDVIPQAYAISLTPDLAHMTFAGSVSIAVDVRRPTPSG